MSFSAGDLLTVLSGGLPALLEQPEATTQPVTQPVETVAPEPTNRDREPFLQSVTQNQILLATAGIVGLIGLVFIARKL